MSTLVGEQQTRTIESEEELYSFFQRFAKPSRDKLIGVECEFFGIEKETGNALSYFGPRGVEAILGRLAKAFHYEPVMENGRVIALRREENWVTLEPGAQVELSASPVKTIAEMEGQIQEFAAELREMKHYFPGITWISVGLQPFSRLEEISWVPKRRYELMADYLKKRGASAHEMMKQTATDQINLDYTNEETAFEELRVTLAVTSIASAVFAHSAFSEGRPNGYLTRRVQIWKETDPDRSGLLAEFLAPGRTFRDYVEYLLEMPMMFIVREGVWIPMEGISFRRFLREGKNGFRATWADFELHLSTAFPEARFKHYLEIRGMDAQRLPLIPSMAAFWKGLLDDDEVRRRAGELMRNFSAEDILQLHNEIPRRALAARLGGIPIIELARELYGLACRGLKNDCVYLARLNDEILKPGRSPAETLLAKWDGEFGRDPQKLIQYLEV